MKSIQFLPRFVKSILCVTTVVSASLVGVSAHAEYPTKPMELIVPYSPGGGTDLLARTYADIAKKYLPTSMGVINKPGAGGALGFSEMIIGRPDGYKIGMGTVEMTMLPHMGLASFKADDFSPIARLSAEPSAISVSADAPWKTIEELMAYAKANPGKVRIGNSGTGAIWHLAAEALSDKTGVKFNHIPYDGANPAIAALLGGHIEMVTVSAAEVSNHVASGKVKILAIMADHRLPSFDKVPTLKEKGIDLSVGTWRGIVINKKAPKEAQDALRAATAKIVEDADYKAALVKMNMTGAYQDAAAFQKTIDSDNVSFKTLMTKLGMAK